MTKEECEIETSKAIMEMRKRIAELEAYNEKLLNSDIEKHNKIVELEKACNETQELLDKQIEATYKLDKENAELKEQIEKMKCCGNCEHFNFNEPNYCHKGVYRERQFPHHDEYHFLLTDEEFKKYFRLPIKDHYQIKVFSTTYECNKFLENLELDYLKDVRVTDNNLYTVTYLVKGD